MNTAFTRSALAFLALLVALLATAASASGAIVINEIETQEGVPGDWVELTNTGPGAVGIGDYVFKDGNDNNSFTVPAGTMLAQGGFYVIDIEPGFAFAASDKARLFAPADLVNPISQYEWTSHPQTTFGLCPDGSGDYVMTSVATRGVANDCTSATPWPGSAAVSVFEDGGFFGENMSGLAYQPSGTAAPGVLWAVKNNPGTLYRLVWNGSKYTPDATNGWSAGKQLRYSDILGGGNPDAEGVTFAGGDFNTVYVATERDGSNSSRPAVLRFELTGAGATLTSTRDWNLSGDLPGLGSNLGLEAITWIPDSVLVAKGLVQDDAAPYNPASHPNHGTGLFFVGVEQTGQIIAYALNQTANTFTRVATIASGFPYVQDLEFEEETGLLWAACDNNCSGKTKTFDIAQAGANDGKFVVTATYDRPAGMANLNNEGFTITPRAECKSGLKPVFWLDDDGPANVIRAGRLNCTDPPATTPPPVTALPGATPPVVTPPVILPPVVTKDTTKPRFTKLKASRKQVSFTLSEDGRVTVTVEKRVGKRFKKVKAFTVGLKKGARTVKFKGRVAASKIRRGKLRISVRARDAAGNRSATSRKLVG